MAQNVSDKLIGSLAIFKSDLVEKDFISSYIPFVATALLSASKVEDSIDIGTVSEHFEALFGFCIDRAPMTTILNKCAKTGLIEKRKNGTYVINKEGCTQKAISAEKIAAQEKKYKEVIDRLTGFYKERYQISISQETAETQFLHFLAENSARTLIVKFEFTEEEYTTKQHSYIISMFIQWCRENDRYIYQLIMDLTMGYLMSSALAYDGEHDVRTQEAAFRNLVIYFDTPFLLRVLGLNDEAMQEAALAMLDQLREMKAVFRIFAHTYDETMIILRDCLRWIENENYNESNASLALQTFVQRNFTKADVQEYIDTLEAKLDYYGISIDDNNYYAGKYYSSQIDEELIKNSIIDVYQKTHFSFDPKTKGSTIDYDVRSISAILKLWDKKPARTYRQARYVLLTTNTTLAFVTRQHLQSENPNARYSVYPCITDVYLGTNIWLGAPVRKIESFSEKKLMADCMSMIKPSESLVSTLQDYIDKALKDETITNEQYYLLKRKAFDNDYLMNRTLSDETKFTDKIIEERLEEIERDIKAPLEEEIQHLQASLAEQQTAVTKLNDEMAVHAEKNKIEKIQDQQLKQLAETEVEKISNIMIAGIMIPILSCLGSLGGAFQVSGDIKTLITAVSAVLALVLALLVSAIKCNWLKCRDRLIDLIHKHKKVKQYKKTL